MRRALNIGCGLLLACVFLPGRSRAQTPPPDRVHLQFETQEAEAVLAIVAKKRAGLGIEASDWQRLFTGEPYVRLKRRETELHRDFTDAEFQSFVLSDSLAARAPELERALRGWETADLARAAQRALDYLPSDARIRAKVFPVIKPQTNSFVYELETDPAIFLYLDPTLDAAQFENTVAHELHHVGYASVAARFDSAIAGLPASAHRAAEWMGAFGEGFAMLAAAGGPDVHPHAVSRPEDRTRWDRDMANFNQDLGRLDRFFLDVISQRLPTEDSVRQVGMTFFGVQGPWYTVGWKMAVVIEKRFGRATLIACMLDPQKLLATYNRAAAERNRDGGDQLALWSRELLEAIESRASPP